MQSLAYNVGRSGTLGIRTFLATPSNCFKIAIWLCSAFSANAARQSSASKANAPCPHKGIVPPE